jgi:hypothetical protein
MNSVAISTVGYASGGKIGTRIEQTLKSLQCSSGREVG